MRLTIVLAVLIVSSGLQSCFRKETTIPAHARGQIMTDTIAMTDNYQFQVYFDLNSGKVVSSNVKTLSDLGFECSDTGWKVILNSSDFMTAIDLGPVPFGFAYDTTGLRMKFDKSDGNPDSLALGKWFNIKKNDTISYGHVYAVNRGLDPWGNPLGLFQIVIDSMGNSTYYFRFAKLNGQDVHSMQVIKDPVLNFKWFSFSSGGIVQNIEPPKTAYQLIFTQYTTLLFTDAGQAYPYLVTGVLLNRDGVRAAIDTTDRFESMDLTKAGALQFSSAQDKIGYDWKTYNFNAGSYTVRTNIFYVIQTREGFFFKLRFIGFYNTKGEKGYPVAEFQKL